MATANDIITDAYLFAGCGDVYNSVDANNVAMALRILNNLLDSYSTEEYTVFDVTEGTFPLVVSTQSYVLGPSGVNTPAVRPTNVSAINIVDSSSVTHPVTIVGTQQWANDIIYKPAPGRPEYAYLNYGATSVTAQLWPLPSFTGDVCHIWYWAALAQFTTIAGVLTAPPGYEWFLKTALGSVLGPMNQMPLDQDKKEIAAAARKNARALNRQPHILGMDLPVDGRTSFNIFTGNGNP